MTPLMTKLTAEQRERLESWAYWKRLEMQRNPDEDELEFLATIEALLSEAAESASRLEAAREWV